MDDAQGFSEVFGCLAEYTPKDETAPNQASLPEGPRTHHLRTLVPKPLRVWFLGPDSLNIGYLDPLGTSLSGFAVSAVAGMRQCVQMPRL